VGVDEGSNNQYKLSDGNIDLRCEHRVLSLIYAVNIEFCPNRRYLHLDEGTLCRVIGLAYVQDPDRYGQDKSKRSDEDPCPPG
jgi:Zn-finger nucleic acid-binding protein